jgi:hypothetical protein
MFLSYNLDPDRIRFPFEIWIRISIHKSWLRIRKNSMRIQNTRYDVTMLPFSWYHATLLYYHDKVIMLSQHYVMLHDNVNMIQRLLVWW